jgi:hypothetical protein
MMRGRVSVAVAGRRPGDTLYIYEEPLITYKDYRAHCPGSRCSRFRLSVTASRRTGRACFWTPPQLTIPGEA